MREEGFFLDVETRNEQVFFSNPQYVNYTPERALRQGNIHAFVGPSFEANLPAHPIDCSLLTR